MGMAHGSDLGRESVLARIGAAAGEAGDRGGGVAFVPAKEKYAIEGVVGSGGMGEVLLATDRDLKRQVAMKFLRRDATEREDLRRQFVAEAQATSQLEHPGIPPIHDIGIAPDGRLWFTMKLVRGRTLAEILHDLFVKRAQVHREWTLHRLVGVVERLCEALHFAHERGVVHRDVKPQNVMLGDYGETHLMDWGLARVGESSSSDAGAAERIATARTEAGDTTEHGTIKGTVPYMAPEQLAGTADRRADVYALGCVLYEVLTLQPAFDARDGNLVRRIADGDVAAVETRNPRRAVDPRLAAICRRAMAKAAQNRYPTARAMGGELRTWLDGSSERERRHQQAEEFARRGSEEVAAWERAKEAVREAEANVEERAAAFEPWQPIAEKQPLWDARKAHRAATNAAALAFAEALKWFDAALAQEERSPTARGALARLWKGRLEDAERRVDEADAGYALEMVKRYDDGPLAAYVAGDGALSLASDPPGAQVTISRFQDRDGVLVAGQATPLGSTPLSSIGMPMGSYLCVLSMPGYRDVRYPVSITRNRHWQGRVRMRTAAEIGEGFVYVPGGPFVYGEGEGRRTLDLPDFAIARYPVTFGEYAAFLAALERERGVDAARARAPYQRGGEDPYMVRTAAGVWTPQPHITEEPAFSRCVRRFGADFLLRVPVMAITFDDAVAYCAWRSQVTGRECRLPTEEEREKAARGVDGRRFPWGDLEDSSLCKCLSAREERSQPEPVGAFETAESVYGMGDAAGGVWDWTDSWFDLRRSARVLRGGSWYLAPHYARAAYRWSGPSARSASYGFRCASGLRGALDAPASSL
jgi:eukaryotic-like serine/threonine-protein kinase